MLMSHVTVKFQYLYINTYSHVCHRMEDFTKRRFHTEGQNSEAGNSRNLKSTERVKVLKFKFLNLIVLPCPLLYVISFIKKLKSLAC